jgi:hypothetical protein
VLFYRSPDVPSSRLCHPRDRFFVPRVEQTFGLLPLAGEEYAESTGAGLRFNSKLNYFEPGRPLDILQRPFFSRARRERRSMAYGEQYCSLESGGDGPERRIKWSGRDVASLIS